MHSMRKIPANYGWENLLLLFDAVNEAADRHTDARTARHTGGHVAARFCDIAAYTVGTGAGQYRNRLDGYSGLVPLAENGAGCPPVDPPAQALFLAPISS